MKTTQKNEYNITVLRGPSISELILSPEEIDFSGIDNPTVVVALDQEGVDRRRDLFERLAKDALIIQIRGVSLPTSKARIHRVDLKAQGIKHPDRALASLAVLAKLKKVIHPQMLEAALKVRFKGKLLDSAMQIARQVKIGKGK